MLERFPTEYWISQLKWIHWNHIQVLCKKSYWLSMQSWCHIDTETLFQELLISATELKEMSQYYFDGKGKAFRPIIVVLMARACNTHYNNSRWVIYFPSSVGLYSAGLPSLCYRVVSCFRSSMYLRIHFVMSRFWFWVAKVTLESGLGTLLSLFFMSMEEQLQLQISILERRFKAKSRFLIQK